MVEEQKQFVISEKELQRFKHDYYCNAEGKFNLEIQAKHLALLADGYLKRYTTSANWTDILKAHALYNSVGVRMPEDETWARKAYDAQNQYWQQGINMSYEDQNKLTAGLTQQLQTIRQSVTTKLEVITKQIQQVTSAAEFEACPLFQANRFYTEVSQVSTFCTEEMMGFAKQILEFSVDAMSQPPPCKFSVVAIGSMAKNEATPFSDLEYIFLVEETNPTIVDYFKKLAVTSYFMIGNLRETKLSYMAIDELAGWFDDQQKNGFKIDGLAEGAGNIPTGNGLKPDHFIVTVDELLTRYKSVLDNPVEEEAKRGDLTAMFQYTKEVFAYGSSAKSLLTSFQREVRNFKPNESRLKVNKEMFMADAKKYNFKPSPDLICKGYTVNSKKELYRYPSILLFNISILTGCTESDSWQTLSSLHRNGILSRSVHESLGFLLACACYFRLSAYLYHGSHDDRLSVLPTSVVNPSCQSSAARRWHLPPILFNKHSEKSITLKDHIAKCSQQEINDVLKSEISSPTWLVTFQIHHYCNRWSDALKILYSNIEKSTVNDTPEKTVDVILEATKKNFQELWNSVKGLSYSLFQLREWDKALKYHQIILQMIKNIEGHSEEKAKQLILADACEEIGLCYNNLEKPNLAEEVFLKCLKIRLEHLEENDELIAMAYFNLGNYYLRTNQFEKAEQHDLESMQISYVNASAVVSYDYYGDPIKSGKTPPPIVDLKKTHIDGRLGYLNNPSVMLARVIWNLSRVYFKQRRYQSAYDYAHRALQILQEMYGAQASHREISSLYFDISCISCMMHKFEEAENYNKKACAVIFQLFGSKSPKLMETWKSLEQESKTLEGAEKFYRFVIDTFLSLPGYGVTHPQTAEVMEFFCRLLIQLGLHSLAEETLNKSLKMYDGTYGEKSYVDEKARATSALALNFRAKKDYESAAEYYNRALQISDQSTTNYSLLNRAMVLEEMGELYTELAELEKAKDYFTQALQLYKQCCHDPTHPKLVQVKAQLDTIA